MWEITTRENGALIVLVVAPLTVGDVLRVKLDIQHRMAVERARRGVAKLVFDMRACEGNPGEIIEGFHRVSGDLVHDGTDRVAIVLPTSLAKTDARSRLRWPAQSAVFLSMNAAELWLESV